MPGAKIAIIGTGAAALGAAWRLSSHHHVTLFERNAHAGGHANTVEVPGPDGDAVAVDTGFIVYNRRTYPNLIGMFEELGVPTRETDMSFAVSLDRGQLEYSGESLGGLFGQPFNIVRPRFLGMVADILRFYRHAPQLLDGGDAGISLGAYLRANGYGRGFIEDHLLPMAAAIWSSPATAMLDFPAVSFVRFCVNHGLLQLTDRPRWRTVIGGSREYVRRLLAASDATLHLNAAVAQIRRLPEGVEITMRDGHRAKFDHVVIGTHADEALSMLDRPTANERMLLGAFRYQENVALLHSDAQLMPRRQRLWASWNYLGASGADGQRRLCVSYWMNRLQGLDPRLPLFVTLNPIAPPAHDKQHASFTYYHPVFDENAMAAQQHLALIQGADRVWFCGSYFGYGFHEDAFSSGLAAADSIGHGRMSMAPGLAAE